MTLKIGDKVRIVKDSNGNGILGKTATILNAHQDGSIMVDIRPNFWLCFGDFEEASITKTAVAEAILIAEKELRELNAQAEYLRISGLEEASLDEVKVYQILKLLEQSNTGLQDKAKAIAKVLR